MNKIKEVRKLQGLSQMDLAKKLSVNQTAVSQWERGVTTPSALVLAKLSTVLNESIDYLLGVSNEKKDHIWDDGLIMDEVSKSLAELSIYIINQTRDSTKENQHGVFTILSELLSILKLPNSKSKDNMLELAKISIYGINNKEKREAAKKES